MTEQTLSQYRPAAQAREVAALGGFGLLSPPTWAVEVGTTLAVQSAIANFLSIPYYPFWSLPIIALDIFVILALTSAGRICGSEVIKWLRHSAGERSALPRC
jgi:hypothetical protein